MDNLYDETVPFQDNMDYFAIAGNTAEGVHTALAGDKMLNNIAQQNASLYTHNAQQAGIQQAYTPGQRSAISNVYGHNLKDNPLGNLNNMSADDTLAMSRAADARNNRQRFMQGDIGARTFTMGSSGIEDPQITRVNPIETQEMRQQRANESLDIHARQRQADLAADIESHALTLQKTRDNNLMQIAQVYGMTDPYMQQKLRSLYTDLTWETPARLAQQLRQSDFINKIRANFGDKLAQMYFELYRDNPWLTATRATQNGVTLPSYDKALIDSAISKELAKYPDTLEGQMEKYRYLMSFINSNSMMLGTAMFNLGLHGGATQEGIAKQRAVQEYKSEKAKDRYNATTEKLTAKLEKAHDKAIKKAGKA